MTRIAVIGGGAAGLSAAFLLRSRHEVALFEREQRFGGHAHTITVDRGPDTGVTLDVGFMVFNDRNYATLEWLLAQIGGLEVGDSDMSFSFRCRETGTEYALNFSPGAQASGRQGEATRSALPRDLLADVVRFMRAATRDLEDVSLAELTLGEYLRRRGFSERLVNDYILPLGAAIWSTPAARMLDFPARAYLRFFANHGLLSLDGGPRWQYIKGGSQRYVEAIVRRLGDAAQTTAVVGVARDPEGVTLRLATGGEQRFDRVVLAVHADEALALLDDPSDTERRLLGAFGYHESQAILHTDRSVMPVNEAAWAAWNYQRKAPGDTGSLAISYHLNRLQGHVGATEQYFLTLGHTGPICESRVLRRLVFSHPVFTFEAVRNQPLLAQLNGDRRTHFCGSYFSFGFHEDAVRSGVAVARALGVDA